MAEYKISPAQLEDPNFKITLKTGEVHRVVLGNLRVVRIRLIGMHFDTSKCFLLPGAMKGIRRLCRIYQEHPNARVLVVGHADSRGDEADNSTLSLERADAIGAFLTEQADAWLDWYSEGKSDKKRWGTREDQHMLSALPDGNNPYYAGGPTGVKDAATDAAIRRFQTDENLEVDGKAGPKTRRALITRYQALDGTSLPAGCELVTHGCGEYFPEEDVGDNQEAQENRRVELFFFEGPIVPPPTGKTSARGSSEYPAWRAQAIRTVDVAEDTDLLFFSVRLTDSEFEPACYASRTFELLAEGECIKGTTTPEGKLEVTIPGTAKTVEVKVWLPSSDPEASSAENIIEWTFHVLSEIPPATALRGVLIRLNNLGYYSKEDSEAYVDEVYGEDERFAVRWFQADNGIFENGDWTDATTRETLVQLHGC